MKNLSISLLLIVFPFFNQAQDINLKLDAGQEIHLDNPGYDYYAVEIKNNGFQEIAVAVKSKSNQDQIKGFGLSGMGKEIVGVEKENFLSIRNTGDKSLKVALTFTEQDRPQRSSSRLVSFQLKNGSDKSIPLLIPSVMNPNLSPNSLSGVDLKMGQEILFRRNGKKHLLLKVDENIKDGDVIEVSELLQKRIAKLKK